MRSLSQNKFLLLTLLVTFAGILGWRLGTFPFIDDVVYLHVAPDERVGWFDILDYKPVETFADACKSVKNHRIYASNGRLANVYCIFIQMLPRYAVNIIDAVMMFAFFVMILKVAGLNFSRLRARIVVLAVFAFWFVFPWYNYMGSTCYIDNYVLTSLLLLALIYKCQHINRSSKKAYVATLILSFFTGCWHEGITCSVIAYLFFIWLLDRRYRNKKLFIVGVVLFIGWLFSLTPSTLNCIGPNEHLFQGSFIRQYLFRYIYQSSPAYIALIFTVILRVRLGKRRFGLFVPRTVGAFAAMVVCFIIALKSCMLDRTLWALDLFAIIQVLMCVNAMLSYRKRPRTVVTRIGLVALSVLVALLVLYGAWVADLIKWQFRMYNQEKNLIAAFKKSGGPVAYCDLINNFEIPFYLMGIPNYHLIDTDYARIPFAKHYVHSNSIIILPTRYEGVPLDSVKAPGDTKMLGAYPMFFSEDSLLSTPGVYCRYGVHARFTEPLAGSDPVSRLSMYINKVDTADIYFWTYTKDPICVDGKKYYYYRLTTETLDQTPRRMKYRRFYDVSTI